MSTNAMQNKHIEHPEDSILSGDLTVLDWFSADSNVSVKIDGAPAIVWGRNPANGKFFVGTKSVFNKVKIKINHSHEEIDTNHQGKVASILHACFDSLPRTSFIYQGDFIGFGSSDTYRPNTITYKFPEVIEQSVIIAPHTQYDCDDDLRNAVAYPCEKKFVDTLDVKWVQPQAEISPHRKDIEDGCKFAKQMATLVEFVTVKQAKEITKVLNRYIREGIEIDEVGEYDIACECGCDVNLIRLWKLVQSIKMNLFCFIESDTDIRCEIDGKFSDHEGYVMNNEFGTFKIVDRDQFSRLNFTLPKSW
jgi:hypothetical protein